MKMTDCMEKNARMYPSDIAFVEIRPVTGVRKEINWAQFNQRINRLASALINKAIGRGDKVFLLGRNSINCSWLTLL